MPSLYQTCLLFTLVALQLASAAAVGRDASSGAFRVELVPKTRPSVKNGLAAYAKALRKFAHHSNVTDEVLAQAQALADASSVVATSVDGDIEYIAPVTIGSQTFELDFDTGSSDLWVLGNTLPRRGTHVYYSPGQTATRQSGETWDITFADGSGASGIVYSDTVTIGETTVTGQIVEFANSVSGFNDATTPEDGILGLAFDSINTVQPRQAQTFFTTAVGQGLPSALFTSLLKRNEPGLYTFGEIDSSQFTGDVTFTDIDSSEGFWTFTPDGITIGTESFTANPPSLLTGIADTGTTLLLVEPEVADAYYSFVPSAQFSNTFGAFVFPCNTALPDFALNVNGYQATVPGDFINFEVLTGNTCFGGIQSASGLPFNIYGDIFLKSQFVVFDRTQASPRIGFAPQA